ncbi:MAG: methionyl-tRNA formyltransferase [Gammaproteobacteria bacterium]|nr:methionyl-tRNA formyltransferase [Gammaproteobacteria bacterium]
MTQRSLIFAGTPDFAVPAMTAVADWCEASQFDLHVMTQPDRRAGRKRQLLASPVKQAAIARGLLVSQPERLSGRAVIEELKKWQPQLMVVIAYGLLLPAAVLKIPNYGCVNAHLSLLPRWRGAAPAQRAIAEGDQFSGVSLMKMDVGMDSGPIYLQRPLRIGAQETAGELYQRLGELSASMLAENLDALLTGALQARPQLEQYATYAPKLSKQEATIDWQQPAAVIARQVRAYIPWPVAQTQSGGAGEQTTLRLWEACALSGSVKQSPGQVITQGSQGIEVATGAGRLLIKKLQRPGGQVLPAAEFINAHSLEKTIFS